MKKTLYLSFILLVSLICFLPQKSEAVENHNLLVIMANFNNRPIPTQTREATYNQTFVGENSVANFYSENSYGKIQLTGELFPSAEYQSEFYTMNLAHTCDLLSIARGAMNALEAAEGDDAVNFLTVDHLVISVPVDSSCGQGLAYVGPITINTPDGNHSMTVSWVLAFQAARSPYTIAHEMGHGFGVQHAGILDCGNVPFKASGCDLRAAHDMGSVMGIPVTHPGHFTAPHKDTAGFFDSTHSIQTVTKQNINSTGVYEFTPYESNNTGLKAIKIPRSDSGKFWYIEFRQEIGFDERRDGEEESMKNFLIHTNDSHDAYTDSILIDPSPELIHWGVAALKTDTIDPHTSLGGFYDPVDKIRIEALEVNINEADHSQSTASLKITFDTSSPPTQQAYCGDGVVNQSAEQCDAGPNGSSTCSTSCLTIQNPPSQQTYCGDRIVNQSTEQCDAGPSGSSTCSSTCHTIQAPPSEPTDTDPYCGDGVVNQSTEQCDAGINGSATCSATCKTITSNTNEDVRTPYTPPSQNPSQNNSNPPSRQLQQTKADLNLANRLKGKILLQVESHGEAWYVRTDNAKKMYLQNGDSAYSLMREVGLGINNKDLEKIPIGFESRFQCTDSDKDGLCDKLESGIGTDPLKADSDNDGYKDGEEVKTAYNPKGGGKYSYDNTLINRLKGKILLQVESHGEAWYINPEDSKRYYMPDGPSAYEIMKYLSLGISNNDLNKIAQH